MTYSHKRLALQLLLCLGCCLGVLGYGVSDASAALDCSMCHDVTYQDHPLGNCTACHTHYYSSEIDHQGADFTTRPAGSCLSDCHVSDYANLVLTGTSTYVHGSAEAFFDDPGSPYIYAPASPLGRQSGITARYYYCETCHSPAYPSVYSHTEASLSLSHEDSIASKSCSTCHYNAIINEHDDDCALCHASTRPEVAAAIAAGDTSCYACHPTRHLKTWGAPDYYYWDLVGQDGTVLSEVGDNPTNPGVHANYLATTAKCGICHSVHRANATGVKLLDTAVATCAGCHRAGTSTVTTKLVSWETGGPHSSGTDASCTNRRCHTNSPHGVGVSSYALLGGKLISDQADPIIAAALAKDTDADRGFNATDLNQVVGDFALTAGEKSALVAGYTCNQADCHYNSTFAVLVKNWDENRDAMYPLPANEVGAPGDGMMYKTGHMTSAVATETHASYVPVNSCVSCHDQTDAATTSGYTFPHSQTAYGATNLAGRAYLWMGYAGYAGATLTSVGSGDKAFDGTCLKCHRNSTDDAGIGLSQ